MQAHSKGSEVQEWHDGSSHPPPQQFVLISCQSGQVFDSRSQFISETNKGQQGKLVVPNLDLSKFIKHLFPFIVSEILGFLLF